MKVSTLFTASCPLRLHLALGTAQVRTPAKPRSPETLERDRKAYLRSTARSENLFSGGAQFLSTRSRADSHRGYGPASGGELGAPAHARTSSPRSSSLNSGLKWSTDSKTA